MVQNELADSHRVGEIQQEINKIKGENMEQIKEDLVKNLDYDHNGKVDGSDVKAFVKDWGIVIIGILLFSLSDAQNEILTMINAGLFNWGYILKLVGTAAVTSLFYLAKKSMDQEKKQLSTSLEESKQLINKLQTDNACMKLDNLLELKQKDGEMAILTQQMNYALKVKELELKK